MRDRIEEYLKLKGYSGAALYDEANRVMEAVGGTLLSHEIYQYKCRQCGENHITKEGAVEVCPGKIEV